MLSDLCVQSKALVYAGLRDSTHTAYNSAQKAYIDFCALYSLQPVPVDHNVILLYITHMFNKGLAFSTIQVYISAIRSLQVMAGYEEPNLRSPQVRLALKAVQMNTLPPKQKCPIDYLLLCKMLQLVELGVDNKVWSALLSLAFFAGLRGCEYTNQLINGKCVYVTLNQLKFGNQNSEIIMYYQVIRTKTTMHGFTIPIGCTKVPVCPVCYMMRYLMRFSGQCAVSGNSPLFTTSDGTPISKSMVNVKLKQLAAALKLDPSSFSTHSIRAGAASTAARLGFRDWEIKRLGGWSSAAYRRYIRNLDSHVAGFAARLTSQP